jgi:hypothetical protein
MPGCVSRCRCRNQIEHAAEQHGGIPVDPKTSADTPTTDSAAA